jgi:hypothetical protein
MKEKKEAMDIIKALPNAKSVINASQALQWQL